MPTQRMAWACHPAIKHGHTRDSAPVTDGLFLPQEFGCIGQGVTYNAGQGGRSVCRDSAAGAARGLREEWPIFSSRGAWTVALAALGVGLAVLGTGLALSDRAGSVAFAQLDARTVSAGGVIVSSSALPDGEVMVTVLDTTRQRLMVYLADAKRSRLRLLAVRDTSADGMLTDWNNDPPLPKDIRARAEKSVESARPAPAAEGRKVQEAP